MLKILSAMLGLHERSKYSCVIRFSNYANERDNKPATRVTKMAGSGVLRRAPLLNKNAMSIITYLNKYAVDSPFWSRNNPHLQDSYKPVLRGSSSLLDSDRVVDAVRRV